MNKKTKLIHGGHTTGMTIQVQLLHQFIKQVHIYKMILVIMSKDMNILVLRIRQEVL